MKTKEIINEIGKLPLRKRIYIIERAMHLIRKQESEIKMKKAVKMLRDDYLTNKELTDFTDLDMESFYEAR